MALSSLTAFGTVIAAAMGTPDPAAGAAWSGVCGVLGTWLPINSIALPGLMVAAGSAVSGLGIIQITGSTAELGLQLALAAGSPPTDAAAIAKWTQIAEHIKTDFETNFKVNGSTFIANPAGGPVTGTALLTPTVVGLLGVLLSTMATDAPGIAAFTLFGTLLEAQIIVLGQCLPIPSFVSPNGGGPVTGVGSII